MMAEKFTIQGSIYKGFSAEIWADERDPGKRCIAIVRDYKDAVAILAALSAPHPTPEDPQPYALCRRPKGCICGGDTARVRAGCSNWSG